MKDNDNNIDDISAGFDLKRFAKATVTPDRTIIGSYDWLRFGNGATDRQCLLRSPAAVAFPRWIGQYTGEGCLYCTVAYFETGRFLENY